MDRRRIFRPREISGVYGQTSKDLVQKKDGYRLMSTIDCDMNLESTEMKGDRIEALTTGKFQSYNAELRRNPGAEAMAPR